MMGSKEATEVQDLLVEAMAALTRAQGILFPHSKTKDTESRRTLHHVQQAMRDITSAEECLDLE